MSEPTRKPWREAKPGDPMTPYSGKPLCDWVRCPCGGEMRCFERAVMHTIPYCQDFLQRDGNDYVTFVRRALEEAR